MQAGAHYFHVVQPELIPELFVQENEMQKAELLLLGTALCKCGQAASRPGVARGFFTVWPSQFKFLSPICAVHNQNGEIFLSCKKEISYIRSKRAL